MKIKIYTLLFIVAGVLLAMALNHEHVHTEDCEHTHVLNHEHVSDCKHD
jgi:hypothetical protein